MRDNSAALFAAPKEEPGFSECDKHGRYETTMIRLPGSERAMPGPCPQCDVIQLEEARRLKSKQRMHELRRTMERSGIPSRFRTKTLADYKPVNQDQTKALAVAERYASHFAERYEAGGCLAFIGSCGTGKTHLASGIGNQVISNGYSCMFTSVIEAVRLVRSTYGQKSALTEAEAIHRFTWPDLLILDEVGMQHGSDNEFLILTELMNLRYADEKPTILISNLTMDKFEAFVGIRVFDRLHENGGMILPVTGPSFRRGK